MNATLSYVCICVCVFGQVRKFHFIAAVFGDGLCGIRLDGGDQRVHTQPYKMCSSPPQDERAKKKMPTARWPLIIVRVCMGARTEYVWWALWTRVEEWTQKCEHYYNVNASGPQMEACEVYATFIVNEISVCRTLAHWLHWQQSLFACVCVLVVQCAHYCVHILLGFSCADADSRSHAKGSPRMSAAFKFHNLNAQSSSIVFVWTMLWTAAEPWRISRSEGRRGWCRKLCIYR